MQTPFCTLFDLSLQMGPIMKLIDGWEYNLLLGMIHVIGFLPIVALNSGNKEVNEWQLHPQLKLILFMHFALWFEYKEDSAP